jgi:virginiamycin B lyase
MVGKLATRSGEVRLIRVPTERARPYGIALDSKGRPWVNLFGTNKLATVDPATFELREIELPRPGARSRRIGITSDDRVWYVDYAEGMLGAFDPATGRFQEWTLPGGAGSRPYAMAVDDRDRVWVVETGSQPNRLVGFDPRTQEFFSITPVPSGGGTVRHMIFHAPSRSIWFGTDANTIGRARIP